MLCDVVFLLIFARFVVKTKEQRAAEKALKDKSPMSTLTLEDFLESERHRLTGTLTPVTEETFAKWKKERLDKKAAEQEAMRQREATGRALFESGNWRVEDSDDDSDEDDEEDTRWNLENMRKETERLRMLREDERLKKGLERDDDQGESAGPSATPSVNGDGSGDSKTDDDAKEQGLG